MGRRGESTGTSEYFSLTKTVAGLLRFASRVRITARKCMCGQQGTLTGLFLGAEKMRNEDEGSQKQFLGPRRGRLGRWMRQSTVLVQCGSRRANCSSRYLPTLVC